MSPASTTFVLGYHGCDASVAERVFAGKASLIPSANDYDWLGHGIYFWEHNARRAYEWACELRDGPRARAGGAKPHVSSPAVVGAIIELRLCLNLLDSRSIEMVRRAYGDLADIYREAEQPLLRNEGGADRLMRRLDCAVIELLHANRRGRGDPPFDTVRGAFVEGEPIYPDAGFHDKTHVQLCVRTPDCIKGYFRPLPDPADALD